MSTMPEAAVLKIPSDFSLEKAALLGCGVITGVGAVTNAAKVSVGSSVAVFGCGGIGLNAIQGARIAGALTVVGIDVHRAASLQRLPGSPRGTRTAGVRSIYLPVPHVAFLWTGCG